MQPTALLATALLTQGVPAPPPEPIPVLIVTGANNHDWEWSSRELERMLEETGRFDATVTTDPAATFARPQTHAPFDAFVLDYNGPRWGEPAESSFLAAVAGGKGVVVVHAANNAFRGWIPYEELVALCWRDGTGHGRFHPFDVRILDRSHPVTRTLPDLVAHPDELYHDLVPMHGTEYTVLADAYSDPETGGTGEREPMIVVKPWGDGRVFHTPLGHVWEGVEATRASLRDPQLRNLIRRGTEWAATGAVAEDAGAANRLEPWDAKAGWRLLFDGETTAGWTAHGGDAFPDEGWEVVNGALRHRRDGGGGDVVAEGTWTDFELELEWKVGRGASSGVKYRVAAADEPAAMLGPEYQILDDPGSTREPEGRFAAGALYGLFDAEGKELAPTGAWNHARVVARGEHIEHWLNGVRVVDVEVGSPAWVARLATSELAARPAFAAPRPGRIGLQDHGGEAWYRSIRVRDLADPPGRRVELFDGESLEGWTELGDAEWRVEDGAIVGAVGGGAQSFLVSEGRYGDFFLELEVKIDGGNSGVQVRSQVEDGRLFGYQLEVDPSERAWSGGLYDEGRRGWLQTLAHHPRGRAAFDPDGWNRYRIECVGPSIRCWIDGVPTADAVDRADAEGHVALQVHAGGETRVAFRDLRLRVLD